jgi:hypothetical protein
MQQLQKQQQQQQQSKLLRVKTDILNRLGHGRKNILKVVRRALVHLQRTTQQARVFTNLSKASSLSHCSRVSSINSNNFSFTRLTRPQKALPAPATPTTTVGVYRAGVFILNSTVVIRR